MTNKKNHSSVNSGTKWVHVKAQGFFGFETVVVWAGVSVGQFKQLLGLGTETTVTVPAAGLPLPDEASLFHFVKNFDTVVLNA
ncbi:hypothetical protein HYR54_15710 [Candidatus Acetothermia bacterium]|nr:hypothetical protein [Candidatus Acetothermia bacterium]MBI3460277.1 hypothetical protein [Candidatus Acetothermia bacterium]MBI3660004.1 hypothetical protein [Candidatus Acetothermia bacterium]